MKNRFNWDPHIQCVDCGEIFHHANPKSVDPSVDVFTTSSGYRYRMVVMIVPNECPKCHNLRVVPREKAVVRPKLLATSKKPT